MGRRTKPATFKHINRINRFLSRIEDVQMALEEKSAWRIYICNVQNIPRKSLREYDEIPYQTSEIENPPKQTISKIN